MLQNMRDNTQGWVTKLIVGLICLAFAVWGLESLVMPGSGGDKKVAKVNGEAITQQQYYNGLQMLQRRMAQQQTQIDPSQLHQTVMSGLIEQAVMLSYAKKYHMVVSEQEIDGLITSMPAFQTEGKFDQQRFISLVRNAGMTPLSFKESMKNDILLSQTQSAIARSAFITPAELKSFSSLEQQKRDFQWATISLSQLEKQQKVSDGDVSTYYKAHQNNFMTPEKVSVNYILLTGSSLEKTVKVKENDLQSAYQVYVANAQANVKPEVAIILLKTDAKNNDDKGELKKAESLEQQLKKGANFGEFAKKYSSDTKSANKQGYLGHVAPGFYGPVFDKAVAALKPGQISSPVTTKFGVVIIKRVDSGKAFVKSLKEMHDQLVKQVQQQQGSQLFQDASQKLADISFEAPDLTQPAKTLNLSIQSTSFFTRDGGKGVAANKKFVQAAFSDDVMVNGNNSDLVHISPSEGAVLHLKSTQPARQETLSEVTPKIEGILKKQKALKAINTEANNIVKALNNGSTEEQVASTYHLIWKKEAGAGRQKKDIPLPVTQKAFSLPYPGKLPTSDSVSLPSGDVAVIAVSEVISGSSKMDKSRESMVEQALAGNQGQMDYADLSRELHKQATIKVLTKPSNE